MSDARELIDACVHCGFCLPSCPTYALWGQEPDSPRGRIYLMKSVLTARTPLTETVVQHFDACLGCVACVPACPSGVQYGSLIEWMRSEIEQQHQRPLSERAFRAALFRVLPYPGVLRALLLPVALLRRLLEAVVPGRLRAMLALLPPVHVTSLFARVPSSTPAEGERRLTVGLLAGCVQRVTTPGINEAAREVLAAEGCEVRVPGGQGCCGALSRHAGRLEEARAFARRTIAAFEAANVDRVVVTAAGCGSSMKEYGELLEHDAAWRDRAAAFSARVRDVSELLVELGAPRAPRHPVHAIVAYHDACHLNHAQGIQRQPRELLRQIPGLELREIPESGMCCGSAGIYNLVQPDAAAALGERKARHVLSVAPEIIATANPGCAFQIAAACERLTGTTPSVMHPIELVAQSIRGGRTA